jgi:prepilin-type N-terminal cleavage/methylation domain-containing protein
MQKVIIPSLMRDKTHFSPRARSGFTMIEIAIVLAIIGLLVGGTLLGKDLIRTAEIRATIGQYDEFNNATNAFKLKYNCYPGDCSNPTQFGFDPASAGNGDGVIGECSTAGPGDNSCTWATVYPSPPKLPALEQYNFWYHLSAAGMIKYTFPVITTLPLNGLDAVVLGVNSPPAKISAFSNAAYGGYGGWWVQSDVVLGTTSIFQVINTPVFLLSTVASIGIPGGGLGGIGAPGGYPPDLAYALDSKLDDGKPYTGLVQTFSGFELHATMTGAFKIYTRIDGPGGPTTPVCVRTDLSEPTYNVQYQFMNNGTFDGLCNLSIQASF